MSRRRTCTTIATVELLKRLAGATKAGPGNLIVEATERGLYRPANRGENRACAARAARGRRDRRLRNGLFESSPTLQRFELDYLKIDKSFVDSVDTSAATNQVVPHIIEIAKALKLSMIAEGVETESQAQYLRERGVQYAQGWLYARAMRSTSCARHGNPRRGDSPLTGRNETAHLLDRLIGAELPELRTDAELRAFESTPYAERIAAQSTYEALQLGAAHDPAAPAIHFLQRCEPDETPLTITHAQFLQKITQTANLLADLGVGPRDVVSVMLPLLPQSFFTLFGAEAAGSQTREFRFSSRARSRRSCARGKRRCSWRSVRPRGRTSGRRPSACGANCPI
jgi:hypothetical protein